MNAIKRRFTAIQFLAKVKTAVVIILIIIISSIAGTVIRQNLAENDYIKIYGKFLGNFILATDLNNVYHSWWFTSLLVLLILSISLCSYRKLINNFKNIFFPNLDSKIISYDHKLTVKGPVSKVFEGLSGLFRRNHFKINYKRAQNSIILQFQKNILNALGSNITHLSIIIILIGASIGAIFGYKYNAKIFIRQAVKIPRTDISFRLDKFTVDFYKDSNRPKLYRSDISVIDKDGNITKKVIEVNKPLHIRGIQFSQSSYGTHGMNRAFISVEDTKLKKKIGEYKVNVRDVIKLPNSMKLRVDDYLPDFRIGEGKKAFTVSDEPKNPALKITLTGKGSSKSFWTFLNFPMMSIHKKKSRYRIKFLSLDPTYYSVLMAVRDPGLEIVLAGFILITIGIFSIFFLNYYGGIIVLEKYKGSGTVIKIKGIYRKNEKYMKEKLEKLVKEIKNNF